MMINPVILVQTVDFIAYDGVEQCIIDFYCAPASVDLK
jgi:hypothetical protein